MSKTISSPWLSQSEAATYLRCTDRTVRSYISRGLLPAHRIRGSRAVRIRRDDLDALMQRIPTVGGAA